jgi:hypothetical protein
VKYPTAMITTTIFAALALGGCTSTNSGNANATTPTTTAAGPSASIPNSASAADPLATIDPCTLLDPAVISQNQLTPGRQRPEPKARTCSWDKDADSSSPGYTISVGIYDHDGLAQLNTTEFTVTNYQIGGHQGRLSKDPAGHTCAVSIGITGTTRVDVVGIDGGGRQEQACTVATLVAPSVEKKLPAGNS